MDILLKCIGVLLLMLWNKETVWILCEDDGPQTYTLPTGNNYVHKPSNSELSDLFSSEKNSTDQVKINNGTAVSDTIIAGKNILHENIVHMEGGDGVTTHQDVSHIDASSVPDRELINPSSSFNDSYSVADHDNRSSSIVPRKGVTFNKPKIVPRKGVDSGTQENNSNMPSSSMESTDDNTENKNDPLNRKCVCCSSSALNLNIRNNSDNNCSKCCDVVDNGTTVSVLGSNASNMTESADSAVNLTSQDSIGQNTSDSIKLDKDKSSSLNSTAVSVSPPARNKKPLFTFDVANDLPANLSSQSLSHSKDFIQTDYVIPVVLVIMTIPLVIVLALYLYKKGSELWERRHYRRMDFLIDGMYNE